MNSLLAITGAILLLLPGISPKEGRKTYTQRVPASLARFEMVLAPGQGDRKPFWIGKTEITWEVYEVWAYQLDLTVKEPDARGQAVTRPSKPYGVPDRGYGHLGYPALGMTSQAVFKFCEWLAKKTGKPYRLPTEDEWRRVCGENSSKDLGLIAWTSANSERKTHPVAAKSANSFGLFDIFGNVSEWCSTGQGGFVTRGGSFRNLPERVNCAFREEYNPDWQASDAQYPKSSWWLSDGDFVGFRVACDLEANNKRKEK